MWDRGKRHVARLVDELRSDLGSDMATTYAATTPPDPHDAHAVARWALRSARDLGADRALWLVDRGALGGRSWWLTAGRDVPPGASRPVLAVVVTHEDACRVLGQSAGYSVATLAALRVRGAVEAALRGGG